MDEAGQVIRAKYAVATDGATTKQGGAVTAGRSGAQLEGRNVARVGDEVTYPDGSKAWITMGCWRVQLSGRPIAVVGSRLSNGDFISSKPSNRAEIVEYEGSEPSFAEYPVPA